MHRHFAPPPPEPAHHAPCTLDRQTGAGKDSAHAPVSCPGQLRLARSRPGYLAGALSLALPVALPDPESETLRADRAAKELMKKKPQSRSRAGGRPRAAARSAAPHLRRAGLA